MEIIPAIDVIDGKCVRLTQGDYQQKKIYNEYPLEVAKAFEGLGLRRLHLVDLDGAKAGQVKNWKVLEQIAAQTLLQIDFGGGVKHGDDVRVVFNSGASFCTIGSAAVTDEAAVVQWLTTFGAGRFLLGADVKEDKIAIHGWQEKTNVDVKDLIKQYMGHGIKQVFCTDISKDGKMEGPAIELYKNISMTFPDLLLIASGGVTEIEDLQLLQQAGCSAAIIGKALYEGRITTDDIRNWQMGKINENRN